MAAVRLSAALRGDLEKIMAEELRVAERGVTEGIHGATKGLQDDLREQVIEAGLGRRVANAWRSRTYPERGQSLSAAGEVFTRAPHIIRAFDEGALIKSRSGFWLAIPTENAPAQSGFKPVTPSNFPEHRFGPLRFVYRRTGASLLVVDNVRIGKSGRVSRQAKDPRTKSGRFRKGLTTVVMFVLVPQVRLRKRLDVDQASDHWSNRLPQMIVHGMEAASRRESGR